MAGTLLVIMDDERDPEAMDHSHYPDDVDGTILFRDGIKFVNWFKRVYGTPALNLNKTFFSFDGYINTYLNGKEVTGYDCVKMIIDHMLSSKTPLTRLQYYSHTSCSTQSYKIGLLIYNFNNVVEAQHLPSTNPCVTDLKVIKRGDR